MVFTMEYVMIEERIRSKPTGEKKGGSYDEQNKNFNETDWKVELHNLRNEPITTDSVKSKMELGGDHQH